MAQDVPQAATLSRLIADYDGWLLDAYGVLIDRRGALPGADDLLRQLDAAGRPWLVLTNSASRSPATLAREWAAGGVSIDPGRILTSGGLLVDTFARLGLAGARCVVLGPPASARYVEAAGGVPLPRGAEHAAEVVVVADQKDIRWLADLDAVLSMLVRRCDAGQPPHLLLCNPDLIYPLSPGHYGFTAGGVAALLEAALRDRYPQDAPVFTRLGKPYPPLFEAARRQLRAERLLMVGDQLATDIRGAAENGIDSLLVGTGVAPREAPATWAWRPTWYRPTLAETTEQAPCA